MNFYFFIDIILLVIFVDVYPYHNKIKQRIRNRELIKYEYVEKYKKISPCLLLYFNTTPYVRPIRKHKFKEYQVLLDKFIT